VSRAGGEGGDARSGREGSGGLWEQVSTLAFAVLIALGIRAFVVEPYRIPSGSMFPTLLIGDHLFVNKFVYGIKVPFTRVRLPGLREPQRGDVVVFTVAKLGQQTFPADQRPELATEEFVKRVIGLPGDRLEFRANKVWVNGKAIEPEPLDETFVDDASHELSVAAVDLDGRRFEILDDPMLPPLEPPPVTVPPGRYFMLGDNRDHSKDSRVWGTVDLAEIKGPAFVIYWSWDFNGSWAELLNPVTWWRLLTREMRWDRIGTLVR
jgi:signal peptidase I